MNEVVVSVLIPYYNDAKYLPHAIESVLNQSFKDFELILVNHATTDNCREIARSYNDPRIVHIDMPMNYGAGTGLIVRKALMVSRGRYFKPFCADDLMLPGCLESLVAFMEARPSVDFAFGNVEYVDENGQSLGATFFEKRTKETRTRLECLRRFAKYESFLPFIGSIFKKECVRISDIDTVCIMLFDVSLWLRMLVEGKQIGFCEKVIGRYRIHAGQMSALKNRGRSGFLSWFEGEIFHDLLSRMDDLKFAKSVLQGLTYVDHMTDKGDIKFVLAVRAMQERIFGYHQAYSYLRGLVNTPEVASRLEKQYGFNVLTLRSLYGYYQDDSLRGRYQRSGLNDMSNIEALKVIFWHFYKICNPWSSLYAKRNEEKRRAVDEYSL